MPSPAELKAMTVGTFDRAASSYDQVDVSFFGPMAAELVARAGLAAGERVLDIGCGRGAVSFRAAEAVGASGSVTGIDLAPTMVELTRAESQARGLSTVDIQLGDAEEPGFTPGSFDAVLLGLVIFLLPDPTAVPRRYARLLRPGGRLAFSTFGSYDPIFDRALQAMAGFVPDAPPPRDPDADPFRSADSIRDLLTDHGYGTVSVTESAFESRFRDVDHWVQWSWSNGVRALLQHIPPDRLPEAYAAAAKALAPARTPDGGLVLTTRVRFTVAHLA